jgi:hypothetical protein
MALAFPGRKMTGKAVLALSLVGIFSISARPAQAQVGVVTVGSPSYVAYGYRPFRPFRRVYATSYPGYYGAPAYYAPRVYTQPVRYVVPQRQVFVAPAPRVYAPTVYYPPML